MSKPVNKTEFWKERINTAVKEHYSVYCIHEVGWKKINEVHNDIFDNLINKDDKVLDAGCGYGRWSDKFDNYVGVDFSPDFIERAKKKYPNKEFIVAKLEELPFKDKEFDWAFCVSIKKMIVDNMGEKAWQKMEDELKRIAKKVLILEYENPKPYEIL